jgi:hypothetical protein
VAIGLQIKNLKVRSLDLDYHEISWEVGDTHADVLDFTFQVFKSESPSGPFEAVGTPFEDRYLVIDSDIKVGNRWRKYFYKIVVKHKRTGETSESDPVALQADPDLIALEIRRNMELLMQEFAGRMCWVFPRRTFGQRCSCFNKTLNKSTRSNCPTCFDTGFVRGYLSPIETWMQIDPSPKTENTMPLGKAQQSNTTARLGYYPPIKPGDLIVEAENRRWRVVQVNQTEKGRATLHQEIAMHEIPRRDIEFRIPLILETALRNIFLSPARNFSNPQNLQAFEDEQIPHIFSLYKTSIKDPGR